MHIILWIAQVILAAVLIWAGVMKLFQPADKLVEMWPWTADNSGLVILTGILDLSAAVGLVFPALFRIRPRLTVFAAYGVVALMMAAGVFHILRGEASQIGINICFGIIAVFIAWGRSKKEPIMTRAK
ncbi:DoxX family protein [Sinomicrobium weinanense]|nr:DoxX family protein [Sinomicrobium weinanense]